ncbi:hypothetical protein RR46_07238 [Papilio xuthus]|uniref:Uncharacterized protein n=1 Tax=Papilio xuthus TaxID=66420 RepID=A0A194PVS8_PAPXU|nr:hypothetical protein RR46_07238 [Papilio xuthus]
MTEGDAYEEETYSFYACPPPLKECSALIWILAYQVPQYNPVASLQDLTPVSDLGNTLYHLASDPLRHRRDNPSHPTLASPLHRHSANRIKNPVYHRDTGPTCLEFQGNYFWLYCFAYSRPFPVSHLQTNCLVPCNETNSTPLIGMQRNPRSNGMPCAFVFGPNTNPVAPNPCAPQVQRFSPCFSPAPISSSLPMNNSCFVSAASLRRPPTRSQGPNRFGPCF